MTVPDKISWTCWDRGIRDMPAVVILENEMKKSLSLSNDDEVIGKIDPEFGAAKVTPVSSEGVRD